MKTETVDVVVLGGGAAGLMCAATAGYRGRKVLVLEKANRPGKKILMSGGGRCNFTHLNTREEHYLSANPAFCISALKRYTPHDFLELVERHGVEWVEKAPSQLFCDYSSKPILDLLLTECEWAGVTLRTHQDTTSVEATASGFRLEVNGRPIVCESLVVATGGLSIPTLGGSPFGYQLAEQFGHTILPTRAGLVPVTLQPEVLKTLADMSGVSADAQVITALKAFKEPVLITHRGLSGPGILQASSYWQPGETLWIDWTHQQHEQWLQALQQRKKERPQSHLEAFLQQHLPRRLAHWLVEQKQWHEPLQHWSQRALADAVGVLSRWPFKPSGTEGYRTAEVTLGGVNTEEVSSRTFASQLVPQLYFIGEVLDVTGHLGGHNFQWAWSSGYCAGLAV
ncbi:MAG TPA: NAD(P)/FAD-dependent oxidoreductase [Alcanivoracaceae bacterium]|nr:NAD(P)/FAD-dependent oxidoreductase [Alcanivoracaceae bacterium]